MARPRPSALVLDGFFPCRRSRRAPAATQATGLHELGLPYAHDPAVTRHLAEFLGRHGRPPTAVLFNGGVMKGELLRSARGRDGRRLARARRHSCAGGHRPRSRGRATAPPTTVWSGAGAAFAFAAAPRARTTSASRARCRRSRASPRRSRRCASRRSAWRRAPTPSCPAQSSASWSARRRSSGSSPPATRKDDTPGAWLDRLPTTGLGRARSGRGTLPAGQGARRRRHRARLAGGARHRGRHARAVVRRARGRPVAGSSSTRSASEGKNVGGAVTVHHRHRSRHHQHRGRVRRHPLGLTAGARPSRCRSSSRPERSRRAASCRRSCTWPASTTSERPRPACPGRLRPRRSRQLGRSTRVVVGELARSQGARSRAG